MKKPVLFFFLLLFASFGYSQRVYFIYLQSDNSQPFYARLDEKVYSSTSSGYLIISSLRDTTHQLAIGFVSAGIPEHRFNINLNRKDRGYLIKNFGERGWGLFDMQDLVIISPLGEKSTSMKTERLPSNQFMDMLVRAADDTTLRNRPVFAIEEKKPEPVKSKEEAITRIDPPVNVTTEDATSTKQEKKKDKQKDKAQSETVKTDNIPVKVDSSALVKKADPPSESKTTETKTADPKEAEVKNETGNEINTQTKPAESKLVEKKELGVKEPVQENNISVKSKTDTVVVAQTRKPEANTGSLASKESEFVRSTVLRRSESSTTEGFGLTFVDLMPNGDTDTIKIMIPNQPKAFGAKEQQERPREDKRFLEIGMDSVQDAAVVKKPANCKDVATDTDFFKLRKKMAAASTDESMLNEARKAFRTKCYSTEHIKNISTLFLRDEAKYKFFDAAYAAVSDPSNYGTLQGELKDEYYVNRFKAMLK